MTFDRTHLLVVWGGTLPGGEIWSNSLRMAGSETGENPAGIMTSGDLQTWLDGELKGEVSVWHQSTSSRIHSSCKLTYVKANYIKPDGHYYDINTHEYVYPTPLPGAVSTPTYPNQVALAVSLTTGRDRGYAHRGRFYSPMPGLDVAADGLVSIALATNVAAAAKTFIESLSDIPGPDLGVSDLNVVVMSAAGAGHTHPVTGVEIGRVLDTQRRRRQELKEAYVAATIVT